jgi:ABC transporter substrate binding protein (PQQ-dependent alcohol dehydrogenase system)
MLAALPAGAQPTTVNIGYVTREEEPPIPTSLLDPVVEDAGVQGARLGITDNNGTGRLTQQRFVLTEVKVAEGGDVTEALRGLVADGIRLVVADLQAADLLALADSPPARGALIFNARARDDALRNQDCRANVLHVVPNRAMLADALAQYLVWKRWRNWFLVVGRHPGDKAFAAAVKRAAGRFGGKIVAEKEWTFDPGARRTDSGHVNAQQEIPAFTQGPDHDVLVVADEADEFGELLTYRNFLPRPVAGTHGLVATPWHRAHEQWGATQFHNRFHRQAKRWMTERDYAAWVAVRSVGEAATRTLSADAGRIDAYIRGPQFVLAAFKGAGVTYRDWDGQMRQPVLVSGPRMLISVSPQPGFLHQFSELDTLGYDRPETGCKLKR